MTSVFSILLAATFLVDGFSKGSLDGPTEIQSIIKNAWSDAKLLSPLNNSLCSPIKSQAAFPDWRGQCASNTPPRTEPCSNAQATDTEFSPPLCGCKCSSTKCNEPITSLIVRLFVDGSPTAISGFVIPVVVLAFQSETRSVGRPHICEKSIKGVQPPLADQDSTSSIPFIGTCLGVCTPHDHSAPNLINRRTRHTVCAPSISYRFSATHATTTPCITLGQMTGGYNGRSSAVTTTLPEGMAGVTSPAMPCLTQYQQRSVPLSGSINCATTHAPAPTAFTKAANQGMVVDNTSCAAVAETNPTAKFPPMFVGNPGCLRDNHPSSESLPNQIDGVALLAYDNVRHGVSPKTLCFLRSSESQARRPFLFYRIMSVHTSEKSSEFLNFLGEVPHERI